MVSKNVYGRCELVVNGQLLALSGRGLIVPLALKARIGLARFHFVKVIKFPFCVSHDTV